MKVLYSFLFFIFSYQILIAEGVALYTETIPTIDGSLEDPCWKTSNWYPISHQVGKIKRKEYPKFSLVWDDTHLYFASIVEDEHFQHKFKKRDDNVFFDDAIEFFIAPIQNSNLYYELEFNPLGTIWDSFVALLDHPSNRVISDNRWDSKTLVCKTKMQKDSWILEGKIAFAEFKISEHIPPLPGDQWKLNAFWIDVDKGSKTAYSSWNPCNDFHEPENFGIFTFEHKQRSLLFKQQSLSAEKILSYQQAAISYVALWDTLENVRGFTEKDQALSYHSKKDRWHTKERKFGRISRDIEKDNQQISGWLSARPFINGEGIKLKWVCPQECKVWFASRLTPAGQKYLNRGIADGTIVIVRINGKESFQIRNVSTVLKADSQILKKGDILEFTLNTGPTQNFLADNTEILAIKEL